MSYDVEHYPPINPRRRQDDTRHPAQHVYVRDARDREYEQEKQVQSAAPVRDAIQRTIDVLKSMAVRLELMITDHEETAPGATDTQALRACVQEVAQCATRMEGHMGGAS